MLRLRWHVTEELIDGTLTSPNRPEVDHLSAVIVGNLRHGNRVLVDSHADDECARRRHG